MAVVFITGVSKGIGRKTAQLFVERGHEVYGCCRSEASVPGVKKVFSCDVRSYEGIEDCARHIKEVEGHCDALINNAGISRDRTVGKMTLEEWQAVIETNLFGMHNNTKAFLPLLKESSAAAIVNIASVVAERGAYGQANYGASKAGVMGYSRSCALEFAKHGIRVNSVIPGYIDTSMTESMPETVRSTILKSVPLGRLGMPLEVAEIVYFLASSRASFVTGSHYEVTGGL